MTKAGFFSTITVAMLTGFLGLTPAGAETPTCSAPNSLMRLDRAISHTAARISQGRSLKIVALGSSSTEGVGASSPANSYPSRLEAELREQFPDMQIEVINRGIGGEDAREELARLDKSVLAEHPDLVLWQVGTNAIVDEEGLSEEAYLVRKGLARLKAAGVDVILIDPQYSPAVIQQSKAGAMVRMLQTVAQSANVPVFRRFAIMSHWRTVENVPFDSFIVKDGLHMNDWSYHCIAKLLATSIVAAASQPTIATRSLVQQAQL
ncbi:MAG TPA: SGNH/GDSL hydrolase family protein [Xanthobacteraceae bacterium]|nr:SGNH/GDSL hydrolase family protein [Xanthobacteraceae bacterium]